MSDIDTVAKAKYAFLRLMGLEASDPALTELGEAADDVVYLYLTRGTDKAQRWMLKNGYAGWRKRSTALSWTGTDATTGGRYSAVPTDFMRAAGDHHLSPLVEANGDRWGQLIDDRDELAYGDYCYFRGEQLWISRGANPPTTVYLDYHYTHPVWTSLVVIDFPLKARALIIAEAANCAKEEDLLPGGPEHEVKIDRAMRMAREEAMDVARTTRVQRRMRAPYRAGNRW